MEETLREAHKNGDFREILRVAHRSANVRKNQRVAHRSGISDGILPVAHRTGYLREEEGEVGNQEIIEVEDDDGDWDYWVKMTKKIMRKTTIADTKGKEKETIDKREMLNDLMEVLVKHLK